MGGFSLKSYNNYTMKNLFFSVVAAMSVISCAATNNAKTTIKKPTDTSAIVSPNSGFFEAVTKKQNFDNLKITSKISVENGSFIPTLDGIIYIENNQKIWMNLSALFLNVARGVASPSGIKAYEKYNKTYIDSDFAYLNKLLNVNFINYNSLQNLLLGRTFVPVNEKDFILTNNAQGYSLTSAQNQKVVANGKTSEYKISLSYSPEMELTKVKIEDAKTPDSLEISYSNWENQGSMRLPKNVKIIIKGQKTDQILIENTKFDFSKIETPYSVPANYTKKTIK